MNVSCFSCRAVLAGVLVLASSSVSHAATIAADSLGYGLSVDLNALGLNLDVGPLPVGVSGIAPAPYGESETVLNVSVASNIPLVVSGAVNAGVVSGTASSNVDGGAGPRTTAASGGVVGAGVNVNTIPILGGGITLLGLDATMNSTAQISGDYGSLVATGSTVFESLNLVISGLPVDLSAYVGVAVAPNTGIDLSLLGLANATLILNEQIVAPDSSSIVVNGLRLNLNLLNIGGEVILGHAQANVVAVPEPTTGLLLGLALLPAAALAAIKRRGR